MKFTYLNLIRFINLPKYTVYKASIREVVESNTAIDNIYSESTNNVYNINYNKTRASAIKENKTIVTVKVSDDNLFIEAGGEPYFFAIDTSTGESYSYIPLYKGCRFIDQKSIEPFFEQEEKYDRIGVKGLIKIIKRK